MVSKRIIFEGRVQGVGFRYTTKDIAKGFEVCGTVRNLSDGTVELLVSGEKQEVADFIHEIRVESPVAHHIQNVIEETIPPLEGIKGFRIERD